MIDPILLGAVLPAVVDIGKQLFGAVSRRIGGISVDDEIKLADLDIRRLQALSAADMPGGTPSQWIVDLRAAFRYVAALVVIAVGLVVLAAGAWMTYAAGGESAAGANLFDLGGQLVGVPFTLIFGERMLTALRRPSK